MASSRSKCHDARNACEHELREDHASGAPNLFDNINVQWLWRNASVSSATIFQLKSEDGMGTGIERLFKEIDSRFSGSGTSATLPVFAGLTEQLAFCSSYPTFTDENNLSMAVFLKCHGIGVMFTGDLEDDGFRALLKREDFRQAFLQTRIYVASHHGRENGCCEEVVPYLRYVNYVIISDKGYQHDTQQTMPFYRRIAKGGPFRGETRFVLTTRRDKTITFDFSPGSWGPR